MREIKFRAWCERTNKMSEEFNLGYSSFKFVFKNHVEHWPPDNKNLAIMQYTGLKDKNGKEIYDRDIFKDYVLLPGVNPNLNTKEALYIVEIETPLSVKFKFIRYLREAPKYKMGTNNKQVIGNIYENKELLNENL